MRIAIAQLNFTVGAFAANYTKMADAVSWAREGGVDLVVFSELATTGYPPRDLLERTDFVAANMDLLGRVAALTDDRLAALVGHVEPNAAGGGKRLFNAASLCQGGRVVGTYRKCLLPTYDVFDEDRYFEPGSDAGLLYLNGIPLGVSICEDVWNDGELIPMRQYPRDPVDEMAGKGARLLLNLSASPFNVGKGALRGQLLQRKARIHGLYCFSVNQVGGNDELVFDGHSLGFDPNGELVVRARDFAEDFLVFEIPDRALETTEQPASPQQAVIRDVSESREEQVLRALVLGLKDYTRKCGFNKVVLGLSGGIDSAVTAALAVRALGASNVLGVTMPARYSSEGSVRDSQALASNLGIELRTVTIDPILQSYLDALHDASDGVVEGVTEENLQARIRGAVLMAFSNREGRLLLSTGNKSELAVGYCTLYGDMNGGLAVISDVPKTLVYDLAHHINESGEIIPDSTIRKPPSAELRPGQTDQDSLPPYELLDEILEAYVELDLCVDEIVERGFDRSTVVDVVRLINRAEYKRRQAAPGLRVTSRAFGSGRRYPIAASYAAIEGDGARRGRS